MNTKRQYKLLLELQTVVLYMLNRNPESEYWNGQLKIVKKLLRKIK